jgi:glycosyltransferase involved in cell wall biosynthesis
VLRLIEAAGSLGYPLVIAGHAPENEALEKIRTTAARYSNIQFFGFLSRDQLDDLYAACEVFALPSTHEGTGLAALDEVACGAKIVIRIENPTPGW